MKAIIDEKLYDTETAERLFEFRRKVYGNEILGRPGYYWTSMHDFALYKPVKGAYFEVDEDEKKMTVTTEDKVKHILKTVDPDKYIELFGEVEEA